MKITIKSDSQGTIGIIGKITFLEYNKINIEHYVILT